MRFINDYLNMSAIQDKQLKTVDAGDEWLEILMNHVDKGSAISDLCKEIGHDISQTVCFGDSENDLAMFDVCGISVAVNNAMDKVKEKATFTLEENSHKELISLLNQFNSFAM